MALDFEFVPLQLQELRRQAAVLKADGWRFIQTHAVHVEGGADLYYSFMKDGHIENYRVFAPKGEPVPSITDLFLAAFVFENEARELFGVDMRDIAIDFQGAMYAPAESEPMTFITPAQKAAREKALKASQKKASADASSPAGKGVPQQDKGAVESSSTEASASGKRVFVMTPERQARLDAKLPTLSEEKRAKVEAALRARAAEAEAAAGGDPSPAEKGKEPAATIAEPAGSDAPKADAQPAPAKDAVLEAKIASLDPQKAAKVRAALEGKPTPAAPEPAVADEDANGADSQLAALIGLMDEAKAAKVRKALNLKGGE